MSRPKTRSEKQAETRAALLSAASELFSRHGLEGASVEDVAAAAGYTKGAFYSNFASKEELFLVMLDQKFAEHVERLDVQLAGTGDADEEARDAAVGFLSGMESDPAWPRLYFEFVAYGARNEAFRGELEKRHRQLRARLADVFDRWSADFPAEPPLPMTDIATMVFAMGDGFLVGQLVDPDLDENLYAQMNAVFIRGLQALAAGWEPEEEDLPARSLA